MKQLMVHIERAVRPVRAEKSTKCNMREELYAHIVSVYEEELKRTDNDDDAVARACRRFGIPSELTPQLQQSVSWFERSVLVPLDQWIRRHEHETISRHTWRLVSTYVLCFAIISVVTICSVDLLAVVKDIPTGGRSNGALFLQFRLLFALACWFAANIAVFTPIGQLMRQQVETGLLRPSSWFASGGLCVLAALTVFGTGWGFLLIIPIDPGVSVSLLPRWLVLAGLTPLGFATLARLAAIEVQRSRAWESLVIDD